MKTLDEIVAENAKLTSDLAVQTKLATDLTGQVAALQSDKTKLTGELDSAVKGLGVAQTNLAAVTKDRDDLKAKNGQLEADNTKLQADMKDFNAKVATECAKHGIRGDAVAGAPDGQKGATESATKGKNLTEMCKAAKASAK